MAENPLPRIKNLNDNHDNMTIMTTPRIAKNVCILTRKVWWLHKFFVTLHPNK